MVDFIGKNFRQTLKIGDNVSIAVWRIIITFADREIVKRVNIIICVRYNIIFQFIFNLMF